MINLCLELSNSQYKLEDICLQITDGKHGDCENQENSGYYFVSVKDIDDGVINYSNARQITKFDFEDTDKRTKLENEDILITNSGTIGKFVFVNSPLSRKTTFQKSVAIIKPNKNKIIPKFLYYYLISEKRRLVEYAGGTTQKNLLLRDIRNFEVEIPDESHQKKIIEILNNIDQLISVNKKLNKNLHLQRKELFKHWFIDFSSSNYELTDTTFGLIPKSWNIYGFKEILTKRTEKSNDSSIPMFSVTNTGIHPREEKFNKKLSTTSSKFKLIYKNDLVFGMSREILNWGLMDEEIGGVSSAYNIFKINQDIVNPLYLKGFIENYMFYFKDIIKPASREGQGIDQNVLFIKQIYVPPENIFKEFFQIDIHFNKLIELNNNETGKLISLRDTLLPKLMSGEIDVSEINLAYDYLR